MTPVTVPRVPIMLNQFYQKLDASVYVSLEHMEATVSCEHLTTNQVFLQQLRLIIAHEDNNVCTKIMVPCIEVSVSATV